MEIIDRLKHYENNTVDEWYELDEKVNAKFLKDLVKFSNKNPEVIKAYCKSIIPSNDSSLGIIYEALSDYSTKWNDFLFEELKRVVTLAKERQIDAECLELLMDIETENLYEKDKDVYVKMVDVLISNLDVNNAENFNIELLDVIDWFLIEYDEGEIKVAANNWKSTLEQLATQVTPEVKAKVDEALKNFSSEIFSSSTSLLGKILKIFK